MSNHEFSKIQPNVTLSYDVFVTEKSMNMGVDDPQPSTSRPKRDRKANPFYFGDEYLSEKQVRTEDEIKSSLLQVDDSPSVTVCLRPSQV